MVPNMKTFTITNPHRARLVFLTLQLPLLLSSSTMMLLLVLILRPTSNGTNKDTASVTIPTTTTTTTTVVVIKTMKAAEAFQRLQKAPSKLSKKKVRPHT